MVVPLQTASSRDRKSPKRIRLKAMAAFFVQLLSFIILPLFFIKAVSSDVVPDPVDCQINEKFVTCSRCEGTCAKPIISNCAKDCRISRCECVAKKGFVRAHDGTCIQLSVCGIYRPVYYSAVGQLVFNGGFEPTNKPLEAPQETQRIARNIAQEKDIVESSEFEIPVYRRLSLDSPIQSSYDQKAPFASEIASSSETSSPELPSLTEQTQQQQTSEGSWWNSESGTTPSSTTIDYGNMQGWSSLKTDEPTTTIATIEQQQQSSSSVSVYNEQQPSNNQEQQQQQQNQETTSESPADGGQEIAQAETAASPKSSAKSETMIKDLDGLKEIVEGPRQLKTAIKEEQQEIKVRKSAPELRIFSRMIKPEPPLIKNSLSKNMHWAPAFDRSKRIRTKSQPYLYAYVNPPLVANEPLEETRVESEEDDDVRNQDKEQIMGNEEMGSITRHV